MIDTVVVDDDFRVARIHAAAIDSVEGFRCVGEAHNAAEARDVVTAVSPDLILLDIYLPDEDGLSLLRSLTAELRPAPDCIFITAARDLASVQTAMGLGAMYYLVKPFALSQLRERLERYRSWRSKVETISADEADQALVDELYASRHAPVPADIAPRLSPTMGRVLEVVRASDAPMSAAAIGETIGISRPTAQRYLSDLERRGLVDLQLEYGTAGRPVHRYRPVP